MHSGDPPDHLFQRDAAYQFLLLERREGIYVYDTAGKRYIDGGSFFSISWRKGSHWLRRPGGRFGRF